MRTEGYDYEKLWSAHCSAPPDAKTNVIKQRLIDGCSLSEGKAVLPDAAYARGGLGPSESGKCAS